MHQCCTHTWNKNPFFFIATCCILFTFETRCSVTRQAHTQMYFSLSAVIALLSSLKFSQCKHNIVVPTLTELGICCLFFVLFFYFCMCVFVFRENSIKCNVSGIREFLAPGKWVITAGNKCKSRKNLRDNVISN